MDKDKLTPMMKQYIEIKEKYQDMILFYRLGDFYEMFFEDALLAARVLEIALTGRSAGLEDKVPMCGVPYHSAQSYIKKLIDNGYKVAICEQVTSASANNKLVKREVVKIITPGTMLELDKNDYNFIMYIDSSHSSFYYLALCDLATGKLKAINILKDRKLLYDTIYNFQIKEVVVNNNFDTRIFNDLLKKYKFLVSFSNSSLNEYSIIENVEDNFKLAFTNLLTYIENIQMNEISYFLEVEYTSNDYMKIDYSSKFNLELTSTIKNNDKYGTLFWYLDKCKTAMGSRLIKEYIDAPLTNIEKINYRLDFVSALLDDFILSQSISKQLKDVYDLARLAGKVALKSINIKELSWLTNSLEQASVIVQELGNSNNKILSDFAQNIDLIEDLKILIEKTINLNFETNEDRILNKGYHETLDQYYDTLASSTKWLIDFESREREKTNIKNLKVKYNKVFGYYIEVSNGNKSLIKDEYNYKRKQTLTNAERYINAELKEQESLILLAQENVSKLENELFNQFKEEITGYMSRIQKLASNFAFLDVMQSFYQVSNNYGFNRPSFNTNNKIIIEDSFHPIIKSIDKDRDFINNSYNFLDNANIHLITGPNMGGKSTYMRQIALIVIMAQIGCYVPASKADLMVIDQIFTRIGASDDLVQGQSTFMVEMLEAANAILNISSNSLILFDELGRGTATYDGMSIAWAMIEYLASLRKGKVLFSTHYHELVELEDSYDNIFNYHAAVLENNNEITFTYKIKEGSIDKSYGIHVATLANLPSEIIKRAYELLASFENKKNNTTINKVEYIEVENKKHEKVIDVIRNIDINNISPLEALSILDSIKKQVK